MSVVFKWLVVICLALIHEAVCHMTNKIEDECGKPFVT